MSEQPSGAEAIREVRATFASSDQMQDAVTKLSLSGFDRADISIQSQSVIEGTETPEEGEKPAATESDAQQTRTLGASTAGTAAALAAAGITIASGGAAAPVIAAAVAAGGAVGGAAFAIHGAADKKEQQDRNARAAEGDLILAVRVTTEARLTEAERILRAAGATGIEAAE